MLAQPLFILSPSELDRKRRLLRNCNKKADDDVKDEQYEHLTHVRSKVPHRDMLLIISDLNAKVGKDNIKSHG